MVAEERDHALEGFEFAGELFIFALGDGVAAEEIDGATFGGRGEADKARDAACGLDAPDGFDAAMEDLM
jgi:hypothetical protein